MSRAESTPKRIRILISLKNIAWRRSCLFFFGLLMMAILAATDSFQIMFNVLGITEESKIYQAVIANAYLILYVTYIHIVIVPPTMRNLVFLFTMLVFSILFRLALFCVLFVAIEKTAGAAICSMIGCLIAIIMTLVDFFIERCQSRAADVMENGDEEILLA